MLLTLESIAIPDLPPDSVLTVRKASLRDVDAIHELIGYWASKGQMLVRSKALLGESIRDFWVVHAVAPNTLEGAVLEGIAGVCGALALGGVMRAMLYDTSPLDSGVFAGAVAVLILAMLAASYIPVRRALRIAPGEVLRSD